MKKVIITSIFLLLSFEVFAAFCLPTRLGDRCRERNAEREANSGNKVTIYNGQMGAPAYTRRRIIDGGARRKLNEGDKSKNQGYSEYKKHFIYYAYEIYTVPHQEGFYKSSQTNNKTIAYEYAFNPFVSIKVQKTELFFGGLESDSTMKQDHLMAILNLRIYVLKDFVVRAGAGIGKTKVKADGADNDRYNFDEEGNTEILQFSAMYIFGSENTFIGITTTTIQGTSGAKNLGASTYGLNAGLGF